MKPPRSAAQHGAATGSRPNLEVFVVDPDAILSTIRATGATEPEAYAQLYRTGNTLCRMRAQSWANELIDDAAHLEAILKRDTLRLEAWIVLLEHEPRLSQEVLPRLTGIEIKGDLDLFRQRNLAGLPSGLRVGGSLRLSHCPSLKSLPPDLSVGGSLEISDCSSLGGLPDGLVVGERMGLHQCVALTLFPDSLEVGEDCTIRYCHAVEKLSEGMEIGGSLVIENCNKFRELPRHLVVQKELSVCNCPSWTRIIPENAAVGMKIYGDGFPEGITLVQWRAEMEGIGGRRAE